jgi:hypothetical protein
LPQTQPTPDSLRPWQFFTLGALVCATAAVFIVRGTSPQNLIFVCLGIFGGALVGLAALNALRPLVTGETRQPEMVGSHTRAALEREKNLLLRSIKELEFDHAMGKVGEADFQEMSVRLRSRAVRLLQELDSASSGYRDLIERELARRLVKAGGGAEGSTKAGGSTKVEPYEGNVEPYEGNVEPNDSKVETYSEESEPVGRDFSRAPGPGTATTPPAGSSSSGACPSCATVNDDDARFCKSCGTKLIMVFLALLSTLRPLLFTFYFPLVTAYVLLFTFIPSASAQFQMPDPKEMSGIPRPVTDLPAGHVSVRLIRGQLSNNIQGHPVEMHAGGKVLTVKTDENGRAEFSGVAAGTTVRTVAIVDGERLESQEFAWPGDGGIRVMLVATSTGGDAPAPVFQPQPGNVAFGEQTRVIIEHTDGALQVYYLLDIRNTARAPVQPASAVVIDMPTGALSATVLGGAPQAVARGDRVTVSGPFQSGQTAVEIAYRMPFDTGEVSLEQKMPLAVPNLAVLMKKVGDMSLSSPQLPQVQEREFEGERYILAQGPAIAAGGTLSLTVTGLPHHSPVPRRIALLLAIAILGAAVWGARRKPAPTGSASRVKQLTGKREKIFNELVRLEQQRRTGSIDAAKYAERRPALVAQLERVYRDLDAEGGQGDHPTAHGTRGGGPGVAA